MKVSYKGWSNVLLRMPPGLKKALVTHAEANVRAFNSEVIVRLAASLAGKPGKVDARQLEMFSDGGGSSRSERTTRSPASSRTVKRTKHAARSRGVKRTKHTPRPRKVNRTKRGAA